MARCLVLVVLFLPSVAIAERIATTHGWLAVAAVLGGVALLTGLLAGLALLDWGSRKPLAERRAFAWRFFLMFMLIAFPCVGGAVLAEYARQAEPEPAPRKPVAPELPLDEPERPDGC